MLPSGRRPEAAGGDSGRTADHPTPPCAHPLARGGSAAGAPERTPRSFPWRCERCLCAGRGADGTACPPPGPGLADGVQHDDRRLTGSLDARKPGGEVYPGATAGARVDEAQPGDDRTPPAWRSPRAGVIRHHHARIRRGGVEDAFAGAEPQGGCGDDRRDGTARGGRRGGGEEERHCSPRFHAPGPIRQRAGEQTSNTLHPPRTTKPRTTDIVAGLQVRRRRDSNPQGIAPG